MASRRRSERQTTVRPPAPKKPPRRSSKTDPTVKPLIFWSAEEVAQIVQAWRDTVANPPARPRKTAGGFNARLYARFVEICGGSTMRVLQSVVAKKQLLNNSYQFILEYNQKRDEALAAKAVEKGGKAATAGDGASINKKSPAKVKSSRGRSGGGGDTIDGDEKSKVNHWFELTKTQQKAAAMKMFLTDQRQYALLSMDQRTFDSMVEISKLEGKLSIRQPWSDDEVQLMFRAWREAINKPPKASGNRNPLFSMNSRMYQHMVSLSNGTLKRTKQSVVLKKDSMKLSCDFISQYNEKQRELSAEQQGCSSNKKQKQSPLATTWFSLSQKEQERVVAQKFPKSSFMYFTESQFHEIDTLMKDSERQGNEYGGRQTVIWTHNEHVLLVRAWRDIVDKPLAKLQPNVTFGSCVYERFMAMSKGEYNRSERSTLLKLASMTKMYEFILEYNQNSGKDLSRDWFSLERPDRKRIHLEAARANGVSEDRTRSFTDFDRPMFDAMTKILNKEDRSLDTITFVVQGEDGDDEDGDDEDDEDDEESDESDESDSDFAAPSSSRRRAQSKAKKKRKPEPEEEIDEEDTASDDNDDEEEGEGRTNDNQADTSDDDERKIDENTPNSFIQVARDQQLPTVSAQLAEAVIISNRNHEEDELMHGARNVEDEEEQENSSASSKVRQANANRSSSSTSSRTEKKRQRPAPGPRTPSSFSLHELADLAMRVNNAGDSSGESDASSHGTDAPSASQELQQQSSGEVPKKRKLSLDLSAVTEVLEKQSEQMISVMREIRDEMRRDREERERFREEMRLDREARMKQASDASEDDGDDQSRDEGEKSPPSKKKKKSSRRLSVQRDGFVVRL